MQLFWSLSTPGVATYVSKHKGRGSATKSDEFSEKFQSFRGPRQILIFPCNSLNSLTDRLLLLRCDYGMADENAFNQISLLLLILFLLILAFDRALTLMLTKVLSRS